MKLEQSGYRCTLYTYPPGTVFPPHTHDVDKIDAVLKGVFEITMGGETIQLSPGDYIEVPRNTVHSAAVIGTAAVISIDAIKSD